LRTVGAQCADRETAGEAATQVLHSVRIRRTPVRFLIATKLKPIEPSRQLSRR
jgi:hypothetical protein